MHRHRDSGLVRALVAAGLLWCAGCKVIDAPETIEELAVFGFVNHDAEVEALRATAENLIPLIDRHSEALAEGTRVNRLQRSDLKSAGVRVEAGAAGELVGVAATVTMHSDIDGVIEVLSRPDLQRVFEGYERQVILEDTDRVCFIAGDCARYDIARAERTTDAGIFGTADQTFRQGFRRIRLDGEPVYFIRTIAIGPTDFSSPALKMDQNYVWILLFEDGDRTVRFEANWIDFELVGLDVPDKLALNMAVDVLREHAEETDAAVKVVP